MTSDQTFLNRQHDELLLIAEAELIASGFRFLAIDGLAIDCERDLERYDEVIDELGLAAGECLYLLQMTADGLIFGVQCGDAGRRIAALRGRLEEMNPPSVWGGRRWAIRDGAR